jgi:hypothetical protein
MISSVNVLAAEHSSVIWNKEVPLKVNLLVWRLLCGWFREISLCQMFNFVWVAAAKDGGH